MKPKIHLRLFVTGGSQSAARATANLKAVCEDAAVKRAHDIDLEIIDVHESPQAAEDEKILVTPTLVKTLPPPVRRMVGDLSNHRDIFLTLDIESPGGSETGAGGGSF